MSTDSEGTSSPEEGSYSRGSSISTGLREEYEELLQYAVVTPKFDGKINNETVTRSTQIASAIPHVTNTSAAAAQVVVDESSSSPVTDDKQSDNSTDMVSSSHDVSEDNDDVEVVRLSRQLDGWYRELKSNVLAEFGLSRSRISEQYDRKLEEHTMRYQAKLEQLEEELMRTKELLVTYEQSINRKDHIIINLTRALQTQKNKCSLQHSFSLWKLKMCDEKREVFTSALARQLRSRQLVRHSWAAWRSVIENKWKERIEKACQARAQEVCVKLTNDYEERIETLQKSLDNSQHQLKQLQVERVSFEEGMKKAFMRGVCALNMEAMNMFHPAMDTSSPASNGSHDPQQTNDTPTPVNNVPPDRGRGSSNTMATTTHRTNGVRKNRPSIMVERHTTDD